MNDAVNPRPKVLFIGRGAPWSGGAGYLVRQKMFLDAFTSFADVTAAMFELCPDDVEAGVFDGGCERVVALPRCPLRREGRWEMLLKDSISKTPRNMRGFDGEAAQVVMQTLKPDSFDAVFCYRIDTAAWSGVLGRSDLLLDIDDPEHARTARRVELCGETPDARTLRDMAKVKRFELDAAASARVSFVCQPVDRDRFNDPKPEVAPNAVQTPDEYPGYQPDPDTLLFVGNLNAGMENPNVQGLMWFLDEVWPAISEKRPDTRLRIGGKTSAMVSERLDELPGRVERLGFVPDMAEAVRSAAVNLAPIQFGTGTRIKVLDALANGGAVVGTTLACEGIGVEDGKHVRLADTPEAFADACVELLNDPGRAATMGREGHALIRAEYSTSAHVPRLAQRFAELMGVTLGEQPGPGTPGSETKPVADDQDASDQGDAVEHGAEAIRTN
ncbi:glycosyltransferase family 4 protein [Algisphaera agarilytica]|uniref:Glycosyltransferase involved in cell wall biosynthesis n=1 Tax=Algisphaera agarilytica TaxID=1385975 RepID=A0A7X0LKZ0_9BACT|nr:glycosyltransferase [Algisphaera agarilytica]MBB6430442.1 glycosyltransferase involved in cell wall biosynthesis [Algisphaera agarilytica]